ncbi:hypothetical protein G9A89_023493 [Geosiphon pyriformis]|nr:hypothetical protein G9A89_023493 [Geosiphon pyriformis]
MASTIKGYFKKLTTNLTDNRWSRYFIVCAIFQAICVCTIQYVILSANDNDTKAVEAMDKEILNQALMTGSNITKVDPMKTVADRGQRLVTENAFIIAFDVFLLILSFDVVYHCDHIELITVLLINFLMAAYGAIEIIESDIWASRILKAAAIYGVEPESSFISRQYSIAHASVLTFFAISFTFFGYKLYKEFEWHGFQQTGASSNMQAMYRNCSILTLLVKLDFFFVWGFGIFYTYESYLYWGKVTKNPIVTTIYLTALVIIFPLITALGFVADLLKHPSNHGLSFKIILGIGISLFTCILMSTVTLTYGVIVFRTFGKGLRARLTIQPQGYGSQSTSRYDTQRFPIDEDSESTDEEHEVIRSKNINSRQIKMKKAKKNKVDPDLEKAQNRRSKAKTKKTQNQTEVLDLTGHESLELSIPVPTERPPKDSSETIVADSELKEWEKI